MSAKARRRQQEREMAEGARTAGNMGLKAPTPQQPRDDDSDSDEDYDPKSMVPKFEEKKSRVSGWLATGGGKDEDQFYIRKLALTNPDKFERLRHAALEKVKTTVNTTFNTTLSQFQDAGYSVVEAEAEAVKSAKATKDVLWKAFQVKFGQNDSLFMKGADHEAGAYKVPGGKKH
jgi:hypothetical protein